MSRDSTSAGSAGNTTWYKALDPDELPEGRMKAVSSHDDDCWVEVYQADINAALNIADRYRSRERQSQNDRTGSQKATVDDSATDGALLTGPQDTHSDAETQQTTIGRYAS